MDFYFNELSIFPDTIDDRSLIYVWVENFVRTCIALKSIGFTSLRSHVYLGSVELAEGITLNNLVREKRFIDVEIRQRFLSIATRQPELSIENSERFQRDYHNFLFDGQEARGLAAAFLDNSIAVSFSSSEIWNQAFINLSHEFIDIEIENIILEEIQVRNASLPSHVDEHRGFAIARLKLTSIPPNDWNPVDNYLPNIEKVNLILEIENFYERLRECDPSERISRIRLMAQQVAELNFYKKNDSLSRINRSNERIRDIYESPDEIGNKIYLSVDFEAGAFEVCDQTGTHIEEILFSGIVNGEQQLDHSIRLNN